MRTFERASPIGLFDISANYWGLERQSLVYSCDRLKVVFLGWVGGGVCTLRKQSIRLLWDAGKVFFISYYEDCFICNCHICECFSDRFYALGPGESGP